jgi:chemotaxis protein MotA
MMSLPIGFVAFFAILALSAGKLDISNYLNIHSVEIVIGGTFAVFAISTPGKVIRATLAILKSLTKQRHTINDVRDDLVKLANSKSSISASKDPLIQYAISLWERGVDSNTFIGLLSQFRDKLESEDGEAVAAMHNVAKYPPALGMMGTVMGMITLFSNLGGSDKSNMGPALATAMTATFYGLLTANMVLNPLADRVTVETIHRKKYFNQIYEVLLLINRREPVNMIDEEITNREAA